MSSFEGFRSSNNPNQPSQQRLDTGHPNDKAQEIPPAQSRGVQSARERGLRFSQVTDEEFQRQVKADAQAMAALGNRTLRNSGEGSQAPLSDYQAYLTQRDPSFSLSRQAPSERHILPNPLAPRVIGNVGDTSQARLSHNEGVDAKQAEQEYLQQGIAPIFASSLALLKTLKRPPDKIEQTQAGRPGDTSQHRQRNIPSEAPFRTTEDDPSGFPQARLSDFQKLSLQKKRDWEKWFEQSFGAWATTFRSEFSTVEKVYNKISQERNILEECYAEISNEQILNVNKTLENPREHEIFFDRESNPNADTQMPRSPSFEHYEANPSTSSPNRDKGKKRDPRERPQEQGTTSSSLSRRAPSERHILPHPLDPQSQRETSSFSSRQPFESSFPPPATELPQFPGSPNDPLAQPFDPIFPSEYPKDLNTNPRSERQFSNEGQRGETASTEFVPWNASWYNKPSNSGQRRTERNTNTKNLPADKMNRLPSNYRYSQGTSLSFAETTPSQPQETVPRSDKGKGRDPEKHSQRIMASSSQTGEQLTQIYNDWTQANYADKFGTIDEIKRINRTDITKATNLSNLKYSSKIALLNYKDTLPQRRSLKWNNKPHTENWMKLAIQADNNNNKEMIELMCHIIENVRSRNTQISLGRW